ncbi:zinc finger MYM-type protein 1-like, partial [Aphis craccivora]
QNVDPLTEFFRLCSILYNPVNPDTVENLVETAESESESSTDVVSGFGKKNQKIRVAAKLDLFLLEATSKCDQINLIPKLPVENQESHFTLTENINDKLTASNESDNTDISTTDGFVEHDPGKRQFLISLGPHQPKLAKYPRDINISINKQHHFTSKWFNEFPMLEYIKKWHKMKSRGNNKKGKLDQHFSSASHKLAMMDYCAFISQSSRIDFIFNKSARQLAIRQKNEQEFNRQAVGMLVDVARTLARQGLAFRSHNEKENETQNGNIYQIVLLLSRHNSIMERWLSDKSMQPYHVTYLGSKSQNEFIELLAAENRQIIIQEIQNSELFAVMADTTPDISMKDQLAVCLRYVDQKGITNERLLDIVESTDKTGYGTAKSIYNCLIKYEINTNTVAFQSYDYASNMSGINKGAQHFFTEFVSHSVPYIPCQANRMNTFLEHSCDASPIIGDLICVLENIYVFFSASTKRSKDLTDRMKEIEGSLQLRNLSKTRWTARAESIKSVWISLDIIIETLENIVVSKNFDSLTKTKAFGLKKKNLNFDFFVSLMFMKNIMYKLKNLMEQLEAKELNICDAYVLINSTIKSLENIRSETKNMDSLINSSKITAETFGIDPEKDFKRHHQTRKIPKRIDNNSDNCATIDLLTYYRKQFYQVLDTLINLSKENLKVFVATLQPLYNILRVPLKIEEATVENLKKAFYLFPPKSRGGQLMDFDAVAAEWEILCHQCTNTETLMQVMEKSTKLQKVLPWANWLCRLAFTTPVTTASSERTFSKLKLIKHSLRSTISSDRLNSLMILNCEKDLTDKIDINCVLQKWSSAKQRRIEI